MDHKEKRVEEVNAEVSSESSGKKLSKRQQRLERLRKKRKRTLEKAEQNQVENSTAEKAAVENIPADADKNEQPSVFSTAEATDALVEKEEKSVEPTEPVEKREATESNELTETSEQEEPAKQEMSIVPESSKGLLMDTEKNLRPKKVRRKWSKKKKLIVGGISALVVILLLFAVMGLKKSSEAQEKVDYHIYKVTEVDPLIFKGSVNAEKTNDVYLDQTLGKIEKINVTDGQNIKSNDVILTYKNETIEEQLNQLERAQTKANLAVNNAQETLNAANSKKKTLETKLNQAKAKYNAVDGRRPDAEMQKQEYLAETKQYEQTIDAQNDMILQAQQGLEAAQAELTDANASVDEMNSKVKTEVRAGMDGTAYVNEKGKSDMTVPVVQVISPQTIVEAAVSEYDYSKLKKDQKVTVKPVSTQQEVNGTITEISQLPAQSTPTLSAAGKDQGSGSVNYQFKVKVDQPLQYGYNVQVILPIHEIRIPKKAVIEEDGETFVYVYKKGHVVKTIIKIDESEGIPVVTEGLTVGEKIVRDPDGELKNGAEVVVGE